MMKLTINLTRNVVVPQFPGVIKNFVQKSTVSGFKGVFSMPPGASWTKLFPAEPAPAQINIKNLDPGIVKYNGKPMVEAFPKPPSKPPVFEVAIEREKEPKIDTSGCWLIFANAVRKIVQGHVEMMKEADEKRRKGETPLIKEDLQLRKSANEMQEAVGDLGNCLKKGKTTPQALWDIIVDEAKDAVKDMVKEGIKDAAKAAQRMKQAETQVTKAQKSVEDDIAKEIKETEAELLQIVKEIDRYNGELDQAFADFEKHRKATSQLFTGLTKEYKEIVRKSDGLTTLRPNVVKALEKATEDYDPKALADAADGIATQIADILKDTDKKDDKTRKAGKLVMMELSKFCTKYLD